MKTKLLIGAICLASFLNAQTGTLDLTFNPSATGASTTPNILDIDASGKILLGFNGVDNTYNDVAVKNLVKLNADGTVDNTFTQYNINGTQTQFIQTAKNISNSNIIIAQTERTRTCYDFYSCYFNATVQLKRMDSSGNLDPFFSNNPLTMSQSGMGTTVPEEYSYLSVLEHFNDKIVAGGYFLDYQGSGAQKYSYIVRFDEDGSLDYTFNPGGTGPNGIVSEIQKDGNGKLYIGGSFTTYNGTASGKLTRLKNDGTLDTTFNTGGSGFDNVVKTIAIQQDGKILVGGLFTKYNDVPVNNMVRLNADGTLDPSFSSFTLESATAGVVEISKLLVLNDGKILFSGRFNKYNFVQTGSIGRLNSDGTLDTTFNTGGRGAKVLTGAVVTNALISGFKAQPDGKIVFAGDFNYYNNNGTKKIFHRLQSSTPPMVLGTVDKSLKSTTKIFPNPSTGVFTVINSENINSMEIYDATGKLIKQLKATGKEQEVNLTSVQKGIYYIKTNSSTGKSDNGQKLILK